jgi:hypothetical protein
LGGVKESGLGVRHGAEGIRKFCSQQTILIAPRWMPSREPHMFPSARMSKALARLPKLLYGRTGSAAGDGQQVDDS